MVSILEGLRKDNKLRLIFILFLILVIWWVGIRLFLSETDPQNNIFSATYGVIALLGAISGFMVAQRWGGWASLMGRSIMTFSLGLFLQEFGQLTYSYYHHFLHIDIPYPSIGDIGYFGAIPAYIYATYLLAKVSGVSLGLKNYMRKFQALAIPFVVIMIGYWLFLHDYDFYNTNWLVIFLDFGYPLGEAVYISMAILAYLLSRGILGGMMKSKILFILFALCVQFLADYTFLYQAKLGSVYPGGPNDFIYLLAYFLMAYGILQLNTVVNHLKQN